MIRRPRRSGGWVCAILLALSVPAHAAVKVVSLSPSPASPQPIGTAVTWTVKATDTNAGPVAFQFNVSTPGGSYSLVKDFNLGKLKAGKWLPPATFTWTPTGIEGEYRIQVVAKDFTSGESDARAYQFQVAPLVTGSMPVIAPTPNPLVALFSAPSCAAGSSMRVSFQTQSGTTPATVTNWANCQPPNSMTFEIAGMYPGTAYQMFAQTLTGGTMTNGPVVTYTTGTLPTSLHLPKYTVVVPAGPETDTADALILHTFHGSPATDLAGKILWYYEPVDSPNYQITRPLANGSLLTIQDGAAWNPATKGAQVVRQVDWAGNILRETNTGIIQHSLMALGATDAQACDALPKPPPVGAACLGAFHHDAIQTLPNGDTALLADIEKIFPAGTQGDTSGLPVDIIGDIIIVLDANWQPVWYFDAFEHASGAPQLDINRPSVLNKTCTATTGGCPFLFLLGSGVAPAALDWLHANSLYYWPQNGDIVWSSKNQDWVMKVDYNNGAGTGNVLWRMGHDGDFTFNNIDSDPYPWFSGQHEAGIENGGSGPLTLFDDGNTRILAGPPLGLGKHHCKPHDCDSRGMALTVDETNMQVTPVLSVDLGAFSVVFGSAQLLDNGSYSFGMGKVVTSSHIYGYDVEILPKAGTLGGKTVLKVQGLKEYRSWRMPSLYAPPTT